MLSLLSLRPVPLRKLPDTLSPTLTLMYKVAFILVLLLVFFTVAVRLSLRYLRLCKLYHGTSTGTAIAAMLIALACAARSNMPVSTVGVCYLRIAMFIASH